MSWAKQTTISVAQRRRSSEGVERELGREANGKIGSSLWETRGGGKVEVASEISGGFLRNYTEAPSVCQRDFL
jgi:hypothetical protein